MRAGFFVGTNGEQTNGVCMTYEATIVIRRDNAQQLVTDFEAISAFVEQRNRAATARGVHADAAVRGAERILRNARDASR
jgi:hypothetical protein